jgi:hypothetical protein
VFLVARLIVDAIGMSIGISASVFALFAYLWIIFPRLWAKRRPRPDSRQ